MTRDVGVRNIDHQCAGKHCHTTKRSAKKAARQMMAYGGEPLDTYRCPHCGFWHNGHTPRYITTQPRSIP